MRHLIGRWAAGVLSAVVGAGIFLQAPAARADSSSPSSAAQFVSDINGLRASHNLPALPGSPRR